FGPNDQHFSTNDVTEEDQKLLKDTIREYRDSWSQDRLERIRQWMLNLFYWRGIQVVQWDNATNCWYDALAWARSESQDAGEDTNLERWINPLTLMFCNVFTGTMSRELPKNVIKPQNADPSLQDTVTAKAAVEALRIIKRKNKMAKMNRSIYEMLFLFGSYFRYTRNVVDSDMWGYDEQPEFADLEIKVGPHYKCPKCGTETPATSPDGMECPSCGAWMGQESYFAAGEGNRMSMKMTGTKKVPRAGPKQTLLSPLEWDMDPKAKTLKMTPIGVWDTEIDFGEACQLFPQFRDTMVPGAESSTTNIASVEKLSRIDAVSAMGGMMADNALFNPTYERAWVQPMAYFKKKDWAFAARMQAKFPDGLLLSMVGELVVDIRPANMLKEISGCALYENQGVYCNALANTAVSFNARFNRAMWIIDDWVSRAGTGHNFVDGGRVDTEKMSGKQLVPGTLTALPRRINGEPIPMQEAFMHFDMPMNPAVLNYPDMLMVFCELILGIPRQAGGQGTQDDVDTFHGQQLMVNRALTVLRPYFENVKDEDACASQNAIEALQALMKSGAVTKIWEVVESQGGTYQNNEVDWTKMTGNVEISSDEDQDLPVSPEDLRAVLEKMWESFTQGNQAAAEWMGVPANQDLMLTTMIPGSVVPDEAQRLKTEADIQAIIEKGPQVKMNQDGSKGTDLAAHASKRENFPVAKKVLQQYLLEHFELRMEQPQAWIDLHAYGDELDDLDMQVAADTAKRQLAVTSAGQPPPPQPDQGTMAAVQELQKLAVQMGDQLAKISMVDPTMTKGTLTAQASAAQNVVKDALDATKAVTGTK